MISTIEKVLFLKSASLFSELSGEDLAQLASVAEEVSFEAGSLILQEGAPGDSMFVVLEGEVLVLKRTLAVARLGPGEAFGEMSLLDNEPRSATITAASDVLCLRIDRPAFTQVLEEKPQIAQGIIRVLARRLRQATQQISNQTSSPRA